MIGKIEGESLPPRSTPRRHIAVATEAATVRVTRPCCRFFAWWPPSATVCANSCCRCHRRPARTGWRDKPVGRPDTTPARPPRPPPAAQPPPGPDRHGSPAGLTGGHLVPPRGAPPRGAGSSLVFLS